MSETRLRIPIEIIVRVGTVQTSSGEPQPAVRRTGDGGTAERFVLDDEYDGRPGYNPKFLGGGLVVPLPRLTDEGMASVSRDPDAQGEPHLLHYHHFTVAMNRSRRLLFFAAWNTTRNPDLVGTKSRSELQGGAPDKWILDPRIPAAHQITTRELYGPTSFDRGHIVRREDAYWGSIEREAEYANFDTFHYTNCTPQHPEYNQSSKRGIWGELENHITKQVEDKELNLCVFGGPVLAKDDPLIEGVKIPRRYWKVVVAKHRPGKLGVWAFLLSQGRLVDAEKDRSEATFSPEDFETYQVALPRIHDLTEVRFDASLLAADMYGKDRTESGVPHVLIRDLADIRTQRADS